MNIIDPFVLPCLPLAWKHGLPAISAVYFAIAHKQVLYIGSTRNLKNRWLSHHRIKEIEAFNSIKIAWLEVPNISNLAKLEGQAISALKPMLNAKQRVKGLGSGYIEFKPIYRNDREYPQYWYHYEEWESGKAIVKKTKYIPKRLVAKIQEMEAEKVPVTEILDVLGVIYW